jgi:hypothetical protein
MREAFEVMVLKVIQNADFILLSWVENVVLDQIN